MVVGFVPVARGQGNITPLSIDQFNTALNQAAWVIQFGGSGNGLSINPGTMLTNGVPLNLALSFKISFFVTQSNGTVSVNAQIMNGIGVSFDPVSTSIGSSLAPISGLAFFMVTNGTPQGSMNNVYINELYLPSVINVPNTSSGTLVSFGQDIPFFAAAFDIDNTAIGNRNDYYILGITSVPEPDTLQLGIIGGSVLLFVTMRRKK